MKRATIVFLMGVAGLAVLFSVLAGRFAPTAAASQTTGISLGVPEGIPVVPQTAIMCTLATTTTDFLPGINSFGSAAYLANYSGLALVTGIPGQQEPPEDDYFIFGNATPGFTYQVEAIPDSTGNYSLGIVVYDATQTAVMTDSNTADGNSAKVSLNATSAGPYYFKVSQISSICTGGTYHLALSQITPTATPTSTPSPGPDQYEPNNSMTAAEVLPVTVSASVNANFNPYGGSPTPDEDWYAFYVKAGRYYRASTSSLVDVDTYVEIYDQYGSGVVADNDGGGGFASKAEWTAAYDGYYYVHVINLVATQGSYTLTVEEVGTPTAVPTVPAPTLAPGVDGCENDFDFDHACVIPADQPSTFNFVPPYGWGADNDYYKLWAKTGLIYECATSNLSPGVDPNMIMYDQNRNGIAGNDDIEPGNLNSRLSYYATYTGWLYVLVGYGDRTPADVSNSSYTLECNARAPGQPTPTATNTPVPTSAPGSWPTSTPLPPPTATPFTGLTVRVLTTPAPVPPVTAATPAPRFIPISLLVYYDANNDGQPGAGEGVGGVSAQAYDTTTGQLLAQGFTDDQGRLEFTVSALGLVRVSVPFFGFSQLVGGDGADVYLRIPPKSLPAGTP